jgi:hypothetical protein
MTKTKIERLQAIKEEFARTQAALVSARKLEESAQAHSMSTLLENDLEQAELVLAAQDMMHKLQNMAEDLAKMNAQDLFPLVDKMKAAFGQEGAHSFEASVQEVITQAMNTVRHAKDEMGNSIMRLEGKMPANDMAADASMDTGADMSVNPMAGADTGADAGGDAVDMAMDDFGGADAAAGPAEEPLGRARKESREGGKALNESIILEAAGQRLIETEGLDSLIGWVLAEAAAGMPEEHFRSFATSIAQKAAKDPVKLAGWIGKKKHGMAAMAQLAEPTYTAQPELEVMEGKSFKNNDDDDDNWNKKSSDTARKNARKRKGDEKVDEGKTFKRGEDADEDEDKKSKDVARKSARKRKGDEKVDETTIAAHAVAQLIEASIKREGKGNAAKAVKEAVSYLSGKNLVEGNTDVEALVLEAFSNEYGMKPAAFSVLKLREFMELSTQDKKNGGAALAKIGGEMGANKSAATKSVQSAMSGMNGQERNAANKMLNKMKQDGNAPKNAGEFAQKAASMVGDETNESLDENINAAHWPVDTHGQYKGEPMSTDYGKLKPLSGAPKAGKTEGGAPETKVEEPKVDGAKAPEGEEKPKGNPFAKKEASEEKSEEKVDEGFGKTLKKAAMGAGAAAAMAAGSPAAAKPSPALDNVMSRVKADARADSVKKVGNIVSKVKSDEIKKSNKQVDDLVGGIVDAEAKAARK